MNETITPPEAENHRHPVVWVIGATRSCKTAIAENGIAPLGYHLISTASYFRAAYAQPDTYSRSFVFNLSAFAANTLSADPDCHVRHLDALIRDANGPCVVEGERNPVEFSRLYDPHKDMVFLIDRLDVETYDTPIERGIKAIEQIVRWNVGNGIAPQSSVTKLTFGLDEIRAEHFGVNNKEDVLYLCGPVAARRAEGEIEDRYPWINIVIGLVREEVTRYYDSSVGIERSFIPPRP